MMQMLSSSHQAFKLQEMEVRGGSQAGLDILRLAAPPHLHSLTFTNALAADTPPASAVQRLSTSVASNCQGALFDTCECVNT